MTSALLPATPAPRAAPETDLLPLRPGRFVAFLRNRRVGDETLSAVATPRRGLRIEARTELEIGGTLLRQTVLAELDASERTGWCTVDARVGSLALDLEVRVTGRRAAVRSRSNGRRRSVTRDLTHAPLFLLDNCFSLHALAAIRGARASADETAFTALPALEDLELIRPGATPAPLGGLEFSRPTVTLQLTRDLQEHIWIGDEWVERLLLPHAHLRVDWIWDDERKGES